MSESRFGFGSTFSSSRWVACAAALCVAAWVAPVSAAPPTQLGIVKNLPGKVFPALVIYTGRDSVVYAVAPNGVVLNSWTSPLGDATINYAKPTKTAHLLLMFNPPETQTLVDMDLTGHIVWQFTDPTIGGFHHDVDLTANGNYLGLCARAETVPAISPKQLRDDCLEEIDPTGHVVWTWEMSDHFAEFNFSDSTKQKISDFGGDWAHANAAFSIQPNGLNDSRFAVGNVLVSCRHLNMVFVVNRQTGAVVWQMQGITIGQHNPRLIPPPLPGADHLTVFDNGFTDPNNNPGSVFARNFTRVLELNVLDQSTVSTYDATKSGTPSYTFFSSFIGSAQRLPNGNTFINEGQAGRIFEIDSTGQTVWEYIAPAFGDFSGTQSNLVYRAEKVWYWPFGHP
jgi:hypothetical protein